MCAALPIRYAKTPDGYHIAYRTFGEGELAHVFISQFGGDSVETEEEQPAHILRVDRFLLSLSRVVTLDPRGTGSSDPVSADRIGQPEDWATDVVAVLDELGIDKVVLTGEGHSGHAVLTFAVTYPERTLRIILMNSFARLSCADDYDIGYSDDVFRAYEEDIDKRWGTGEFTAAFAPGLVPDPALLAVFARRERLDASPATAMAMMRAMQRADVRDKLSRVAVPTLVYYTADLPLFTLEHSRYLADRIEGAVFIEAPGRDYYLADDPDRLGAWADFIAGGPAGFAAARRVATVLFVDVVGSTAHAASLGDERWTQTLEGLDAWASQEIAARGGRLVKQTGDGYVATFESPSDAVRAAVAIASGVHVLGLSVRCGLHSGEVEFRQGGDIGGIAVHTAARVMDAAGPKQVLVSRTVADLAAGAGFLFEDCGERQLKGVPGTWQLYEVKP